MSEASLVIPAEARARPRRTGNALKLLRMVKSFWLRSIRIFMLVGQIPALLRWTWRSAPGASLWAVKQLWLLGIRMLILVGQTPAFLQWAWRTTPEKAIWEINAQLLVLNFIMITWMIVERAFQIVCYMIVTR